MNPQATGRIENVRRGMEEEQTQSIAILRERDDYSGEFDHFLAALSLTLRPREFREKYRSPLAGLYCIQVPLELFDAAGFQPLRLCNGSSAVHQLCSADVPPLACPVIKSCLGGFALEESLENLCDILVVPTTCDWNTKLPAMIDNGSKRLHVMELPHVKESERGRKRWLEEVIELKRALEKHAGRRIRRHSILASLEKYAKAWEALGKLVELRRQGGIAGSWAIVLANAFMVDEVQSWTSKINSLLDSYTRPEKEIGPRVFLAGSPVCFPSLKVVELAEEAGLSVAADELCTSERILVGAPVYDDPSEQGILTALAERYHLACSCPTFADNDRRVRNILATMRRHDIRGVIYHVLKGCHPYDIESFQFEKTIKGNGFRFVKIETDYAREDRQSILTRFEAFRETLC